MPVNLAHLPAAERRDLTSAADRALKKGVNYTHQAMIDLIISCPGICQYEIAAHFGYTQSWLSTIMASDAFQAALAARREQIVDPTLRATLEEQTRGLYQRSIEVLREKFDKPADEVPDNLALGMFTQSARALGYGARPEPKPADDAVGGLIKHADNLVALLRKEKSRINTEEAIDGEVTGSGPG